MTDTNDTLHLVLKGKYYDMIASGEKKEEYREIKPYWIKRLRMAPHPFKKTWVWGGFYQLKKVCFHCGYTNITMMFEIKNIKEGQGNPEWGAPAGKDVFIIELGEVVSKKEVVPIDEFCQDCPYYDIGNENSRFDDVCKHPDNVLQDGKFGQCLASQCPLASFAEEDDFLEAGLTKDDVNENSVFIYNGITAN